MMACTSVSSSRTGREPMDRASIRAARLRAIRRSAYRRRRARANPRPVAARASDCGNRRDDPRIDGPTTVKGPRSKVSRAARISSAIRRSAKLTCLHVIPECQPEGADVDSRRNATEQGRETEAFRERSRSGDARDLRTVGEVLNTAAAAIRCRHTGLTNRTWIDRGLSRATGWLASGARARALGNGLLGPPSSAGMQAPRSRVAPHQSTTRPPSC